jgi:Zn-dependent protease with chaperone function
MTAPLILAGRYFDGLTAAAHEVSVRLSPDGVAIDNENLSVFWPATQLVLVERTASEIRLGDRKDAHARLILDAEDAARPLSTLWPDLLSGRRERRRMTALIVGLILGTGVAAAAIFIGAPAASGPLARATSKDLEMRMGENLAAQINVIVRPCKNQDAAIAALQPVLDRFAAENDVGFPIVFRFVQSPTPNAFALPGGQVMATSGLANALAKDQEAFLAVMAHELGHVKARDGLTAIYRNAGIGVALDIITGGSGAAQQAVILAGQVSQLRHTRRQESRADETAAEIMLAAGLDPAALARAFDAIRFIDPEEDESARGDREEIPSWLSSHPNTEARVAAALARARPGGPPPLSPEDWTKVAAACEV